MVKIEPVAWQWRKKDELWTQEYTFTQEVFATNDFSEVRALYTASQLEAAVEQERERCAKLCDGLVMALDHGGNEYRREGRASQCAAAIRGEPAIADNPPQICPE